MEEEEEEEEKRGGLREAWLGHMRCEDAERRMQGDGDDATCFGERESELTRPRFQDFPVAYVFHPEIPR